MDFAICPFDSDVICCAGDDGRVKVWKVKSMSDDGIESEEIAELEGMEKIIQVDWHPFTKDIITVLCIDSGNYEIRLWTYGEGGYRRIPFSYTVFPLLICGVDVGVFNVVGSTCKPNCCCWRRQFNSCD